MKLTTDFWQLDRCIEEMGAELAEFSVEVRAPNQFDIDGELERGIEVSLDDLELTEGLLSLSGRQVLLFIPDQGYKVRDVIAGSVEGKKFHVSECRTLKEKRRDGTFDRYMATNNLSGEFDVFGIDGYSHEHIEGVAKLSVCKNCLSNLNYKGYSTPRGKSKGQIYKEFSIDEFFESYSSVFSSQPKHTKETLITGYTVDWSEVSQRVRQQAEYVCQTCNVDLSEHKHLLHVHHKDGVKGNNSVDNLVALCAPCHREAPNHKHIFVQHEDQQLINRLRNEQRLLPELRTPPDTSEKAWVEAFKFADPAIHGALDMVRHKKRWPAPVVGYEITDVDGEVVLETECAWPHRKTAIIINYSGEKHQDWHIGNCSDFMKWLQQSK